jgi:hypothetical protein
MYLWSPREDVPSRSQPPAVGVTALAFGIAGTAAGAGVASAHLAKAGLDAAAGVAALVLAAGIILLIWEADRADTPDADTYHWPGRY